MSKTGFELTLSNGYSPKQFFTRDCNVIFRNYWVSIARTICNTTTPVHGAMAKFADR